MHRAQIDDFMVHLTINYPAVRYRLVGDALQGAEYIVTLTTALAKQFYYQPSRNFLTFFGGGKDTGASADLEAMLSGMSSGRTILARMLHAIPGVGPRNAQANALSMDFNRDGWL